MSLIPEYLYGREREEMWGSLGRELYFLFWVFTLDSIYTPTTQYEQHIQRLEKKSATLEDEKLLAGNDGQQTSSS